MVLFPEARRAVDEAAGSPDVWETSLEALRESDRRLVAAAPRDEVADVQEIDADGVPCRLYVPLRTRSQTLVVHLHGGGFVFGGLETQDPACRRMASRFELPVLSVGYRLAPEHKFPAARDDVETVGSWLIRNVWTSLVAHGDSAGANLALVAALRAPDRFRALVLVYPFLDPRASAESYSMTDTDFPREQALWFWDQYVSTTADLDDPDVAPMRSPAIATLTPTLVVTAEHDPLRDEGEAFAATAAGLGVPVTATRYLGQLHGFWGSIDAFPAADALLDQTDGFLRRWAPS